MVLLLIVLGIGIGIYLSQKKNITQTSVLSGETTNWKTYNNESIGFSFKYPPGYNIEEGGTGELSGNSSDPSHGVALGKIEGYLSLTNKTAKGSPKIRFLYNSDGQPGYHIEVYYCTKIEDGGLKITKRKVYSGKDIIEDFKESFLKEKLIAFHIGSNGMINADKALMKVSLSFERNGPDYEKEFQQIVNTMRFTKENLFGTEDTCKE